MFSVSQLSAFISGCALLCSSLMNGKQSGRYISFQSGPVNKVIFLGLVLNAPQMLNEFISNWLVSQNASDWNKHLLGFLTKKKKKTSGHLSGPNQFGVPRWLVIEIDVLWKVASDWQPRRQNGALMWCHCCEQTRTSWESV